MKSSGIGRPRGFDADEALDKAVLAFKQWGYDGVSLTDLARTMGITKTSLYAAFGNKDDLFRKALERYAEGPGGYGTRALLKPTAREVAAAYLAGSILTATWPGEPAGCLAVQAYMASGHLEPTLSGTLRDWRTDGRTRLRDRFQQAVTEGDLPAEADPDDLAHYLMTTADGLAIQAVSGATREELQRVADTVIRNWPPV